MTATYNKGQNKGAGFTLGVDTALNGCQLALYNPQDRSVHTQIHPDMRGQTEHLLPMLETLLNDAQVKYEDISLIVGITGPGSFTGIRIGLAVVNALQLSLNVPALGLDSFSAFRLAEDSGGVQRVVIDSYRDELFFADIDEKLQISQSGMALPENIGATDLNILGNGRERMELNPQRLDLAQVLPALHDRDQIVSLAQYKPLAPYYIRDADTSESKQQTWSVQSVK